MERSNLRNPRCNALHPDERDLIGTHVAPRVCVADFLFCFSLSLSLFNKSGSLELMRLGSIAHSVYSIKSRRCLVYTSRALAGFSLAFCNLIINATLTLVALSPSGLRLSLFSFPLRSLLAPSLLGNDITESGVEEKEWWLRRRTRKRAIVDCRSLSILFHFSFVPFNRFSPLSFRILSLFIFFSPLMYIFLQFKCRKSHYVN